MDRAHSTARPSTIPRIGYMYPIIDRSSSDIVLRPRSTHGARELSSVGYCHLGCEVGGLYGRVELSC
jgi:hypothetical protein